MYDKPLGHKWTSALRIDFQLPRETSLHSPPSESGNVLWSCLVGQNCDCSPHESVLFLFSSMVVTHGNVLFGKGAKGGGNYVQKTNNKIDLVLLYLSLSSKSNPKYFRSTVLWLSSEAQNKHCRCSFTCCFQVAAVSCCGWAVPVWPEEHLVILFSVFFQIHSKHIIMLNQAKVSRQSFIDK